MSQLDEIRQKAFRPAVERGDVLEQEGSSEAEKTSKISQFPVKETVGSQQKTIAQKSLKTQQKGIRLEEAIATYLDQVCLTEKVTAETIMEAVLVEMENNARLYQKIVKSAQKRRQKRFKLGRYRAKQTELARLEEEVADLL